jgi:hypothetical protein
MGPLDDVEQLRSEAVHLEGHGLDPVQVVVVEDDGRDGSGEPASVAMRASEIPGATTARVADPRAPIPLKVSMIPQTVPNRPMKGLALPVVARNPRAVSIFVVSELQARFIARSTLSIAAMSPTGLPASWPSLPVPPPRTALVSLASSVYPARKTSASEA